MTQKCYCDWTLVWWWFRIFGSGSDYVLSILFGSGSDSDTTEIFRIGSSNFNIRTTLIWNQILVWRNVRPVYLRVFAYILICRFTIFKLADGFKIHDIKWKCESFESRSMVL